MSKKILYSVIGVVVLSFVLLLVIGLNTPTQQKPIEVTQSSQTVVPTSVTTLDTQKLAAMLSASTDYYSQLLTRGKEVLGSTQYPNATVGLSALQDENSAASKFRAFRTDTCVKNDPSVNAMDTYRTVSDMYSSDHVQSPDTLDNWNYDINTVASDICAWASTATDWQISKVSSAQLKLAEQKVTTDLAQVRKDLAQTIL